MQRMRHMKTRNEAKIRVGTKNKTTKQRQKHLGRCCYRHIRENLTTFQRKMSKCGTLQGYSHAMGGQREQSFDCNVSNLL